MSDQGLCRLLERALKTNDQVVSERLGRRASVHGLRAPSCEATIFRYFTGGDAGRSYEVGALILERGSRDATKCRAGGIW
jgi:hypothetical protein